MNMKSLEALRKRALKASEAGEWQQAERLLGEAEHVFRRMTCEIIMRRGDALRKTGRPDEAVAVFAGAALVLPGEVTPHLLIAETRRAQRRYDETLVALEQALLRRPQHRETWFSLVEVCYLNKNFDRALQEAERTLEQFPDFLNLYHLQAVILRQTRRFDEAMAVYATALAKFPDDAQTHIYAANLYKYHLGDFSKAAEHYRRAIEIRPDDLKTAAIYSECVSNARKGDEGANFELGYHAAKKVLEHGTPPPELAGFLQGALMRACDFEAVQQLGDAQTLMQYWGDTGQPGRLHHRMARVKTLQDRKDLLQAHVHWGEKVEAVPRERPARAVRKSEKVRVAFMSSDLRHHPVTYFVHPLLELYDRSRFEVFCYSFWPQPADEVQKRLASVVDRFTVLPGLSDVEVAKHIAADAPDILFELGGTTHMNRAEMLPYRPAPVQVSWLGYPHSLGLPSADYLWVDPFLCPAPNLMCEKPFMMPETWVTLGRLGFHDQPIDPALPETRRGYLTFGSLNQPYKYTDESFDAWSEILRAVPGSHFLFVRPESGSEAFRNNICGHFERRGIRRDRIEFRPVRGNHMRHYNDIDISLDTFPHTGGTTTCETLWMGVPVVSLVGPSFFERISYSNLCNSGLRELCAFDVAEYVAIAVELAEDRARRHDLRYGLRSRIAAHPLGQHERFVRAFEERTLATVGSNVSV